MNINETLKQRQVTYGSFEDVAEDTQTMMSLLPKGALSAVIRVLEFGATKFR